MSRNIVKLISVKKNNWANTARYKDCNESLAPYWRRNGSIYTGLENISDEELKSLEKDLGKELKSNSDFWNTFHIKISGKEIHLNLDIPYDRLKYYFLLNHKDVAKSFEERKPHTKYVLENGEDEAKKGNLKAAIERKAIMAFDKLSGAQRRKALRLYGIKSDSSSDEIVENTLYELIKESPQKFIDMWVDNDHKDTQVLIEEAIQKNVIRKAKNMYYYGSDVIGRSLEDTIHFLEDKNNQDILIVITNTVKAKVA